jgi:hypothetical protein
MGFITERDLRSAVAAATAAPSVHNTQPWLFRPGSETVHVYADARRQLPIADPAGREMHISIGAAVFNLRVAIAALGWQPRVTLFPDPRDRAHVATVQAGEPRRPDESDSAMYDAIPRRHTNRHPYSNDSRCGHQARPRRAAAGAPGRGTTARSARSRAGRPRPGC